MYSKTGTDLQQDLYKQDVQKGGTAPKPSKWVIFILDLAGIDLVEDLHHNTTEFMRRLCIVFGSTYKSCANKKHTAGFHAARKNGTCIATLSRITMSLKAVAYLHEDECVEDN